MGALDENSEAMTRFLLLAVFAAAAEGHVGSPDVFLEGAAGPYPLYVTIRPPAVIPGIAEIEIRSSSPDIRELRVTPVPLTGAAAKFAPTPDLMRRSKLDAQFFTGSLWIMAPGSWQVRVQAAGAQGPGQLSVPVPAAATTTRSMQFALGAILLVMMAVLAVGLVSIVGAGAREGRLEPGAAPDSQSKSRARILMGVTAALVVLILWGGNHWWTAEATGYAGYIYKPLEMSATIESNNHLVLKLRNPAWSVQRKIDDFLPDHGHLMHLYMLRAPDADRVYHLHPEMTSSGVFTHDLPPVPAGRYQLYGDVVHRSGFPETIVATLNVDHDIAGTPISGDDAAGSRIPSPDGVQIVWDRDPNPIKARRPQIFKFRLVDKAGAPVPDMELYMGMLGHAAFVKNDGSVFAHVHPSGSVPMAALALANPQSAEDHSMHHMQSLPAEAGFPYGFPNPGNYRIIVQMKHAGTVETGIFDAAVVP
jgi:hypothetical protein